MLEVGNIALYDIFASMKDHRITKGTAIYSIENSLSSSALNNVHEVIKQSRQITFQTQWTIMTTYQIFAE